MKDILITSLSTGKAHDSSRSSVSRGEGLRVTRGVGLQPETLADLLLKSFDLKISQNVELPA
eukprot:1137556-Pelagomonas_calceolata.AAC.4